MEASGQIYTLRALISVKWRPVGSEEEAGWAALLIRQLSKGEKSIASTGIEPLLFDHPAHSIVTVRSELCQLFPQECW